MSLLKVIPNVDLVCKTKLNKTQAQQLLIAAIKSEIGIDTDVTQNQVPEDEYYCLNVDPDDEDFCCLVQCTKGSDDISVSFEYLLDIVSGKKEWVDPNVTVEVSSEYNAVVSPNGVKVGCKYFTHEKIEELYKAVKEMKKVKF